MGPAAEDAAQDAWSCERISMLVFNRVCRQTDACRKCLIREVPSLLPCVSQC